MRKEEQIIKPNTWLLGKVISMRKRYTIGEYLDFHLSPEGERIIKGRVSILKSTAQNSGYNNFLKKFDVKSENELIGKEIYYKYYIKRVVSATKENLYDIVDIADIKTKKEFELEEKILKIAEGESGFIKSFNSIFNPSDQADKNLTKYKGGATIKLFRQGFVTPITTIDLENFYSNIILTNKFTPKNDREEEYRKAVEILSIARGTGEILGKQIDKKKLKILTESLVGCLNNENFILYDSQLYKKIIEEGKRIIERVVLKIKRTKEELDKDYLEIIRIHTDGIVLKSKQNVCKDLVLKLNEFLSKSESFRYVFRYEGYHQRGLFKNVNNFALWKTGEKVKIKGQFFKEFSELVELFLEGHYPINFQKYEELKEKLLKNFNPKKKLKLMKILDYLEKVKPKRRW